MVTSIAGFGQKRVLKHVSYKIVSNIPLYNSIFNTWTITALMLEDFCLRFVVKTISSVINRSPAEKTELSRKSHVL